MEAFTDYYTVLGVDAHAPADTIKAAFKKLALQYHPDVYKGEDAEERMRLLLLAYQTLSDPASRRNYDVLRAEHLDIGVNGTAHPHSYTATGTPVKKTSTTKGADGRHFAFPNLDGAIAYAVEFDLDGFKYKLWPDDALLLKREGMLRGVAQEALGTSTRAEHYCHRCHHRWTSQANKDVVCPSCKASDWNEYLLLPCMHCHAVFESQEIRDKILGGRLYFPYELFPLCPNCRRSQWCAAENARVDVLRAAAARRRMLLLTSVVVITLLVVGVLAFALTR